MDKKKQKEENKIQVLSVFLDDQIFGIPALDVQDVLRPLNLTSVPLAPPYIKGVSNLRGRIVTAIDLRRRIQHDAPSERDSMNIVIERGAELYSILVDRVGDVLNIDLDDIEAPPVTLSSGWRDVAKGVHQLEGKIMIMLDVNKILHTQKNKNEERAK